jgi:type I restriction enzyme S subunit
MREGWATKPLRDYCEDYKQDIVDGPFGANLKREHYVDSGVPVLKIQNIKPFVIELKKMDYVTPEKAGELQRHAYKKGDIVITKLGLPLGASAIVEDIPDGIIVADLVRVRAQKIDTKYLCYHLNSPATNAYLNSLQGGATRPRVQISAVRDLPISAPSLKEQQRIVAILDEAFAGIATATANAEKNLKNARELFESTLQSVFAEKGDGWVESALEEYVRFIDYRGRTPEKTEYGLRLITAKNVKKGFIQLEPKEYVNPDIYDEWMTRGFPKQGDVLFTTEAPLGNVAQLDSDEKVVFAQRIIILQPDRKVIDPTFLKYLLLSEQAQRVIHDQGTGATATGIKAKLLKKIKIQYPASVEEQSMLVKKLESLETKCKILEQLYKSKLNEFAELKQSILQKVFAGELH